MMLNYKILTKEISDEKIPVIEAEEPFRIIGDLSFGHLANMENVNVELLRINKVVNGEKELYKFGGVEACLLIVGKETTDVIDVFEEKSVGNIPTEEIVKLLNDWKAHLEKLNKNQSI
jgi:hypothetical protein